MVHFSTACCSESSSYTRIGGLIQAKMLMFGDNCATKSATGIWLGLRKSTAQGGVPYLWHLWKNRYMKEQVIRTIVDIPASLFRKLKEQAAAQGRSVRKLILLGVRVTLIEGKRPRIKRSSFPSSPQMGQKSICPTNRSMNTLNFLDADGSAVGSTYSLRNGAGVPGEVARREVLFSADSRS